MREKEKYVLEERPQTEVYLTDSGYIGIRQKIRDEETTVLFTPDEAKKIGAHLLKFAEKANNP